LGTVTLDMSQACINSVKANAPQAEIVFDRLHVQRLAHDALDQVRRALVAKHTAPEQRHVLKKRFVLQNPSPTGHQNLEAEPFARLHMSTQPAALPITTAPARAIVPPTMQLRSPLQPTAALIG
jgi:transposase